MNNILQNILIKNILITKKSADYELLDSGAGEKLERYGKVVLARPDPQAIWPKLLSKAEWEKVDAVFTRHGPTGKWGVVDSSQHLVSREKAWSINLEGLNFKLQLLPSKHLGLFPEQSAQWKWLENKIVSRISPELSLGTEKNKAQATTVLNLFAYTGGASIACAKAGASVVHVDASKFAVDLAYQNAKATGVDKSIRFIVDDVRKFVEREIKRGNKYDIILMDPPVYGKGAKGESWKIETDLMPFLSRVKSILSESPVAIVLNGYASGYSSVTYAQMLSVITSDLKGSVSSGELAIKESSGGRLLPCGIFARYESN